MTPKQRAEEVWKEWWLRPALDKENAVAIIERALLAQKAEHEAEIAEFSKNAVAKGDINREAINMLTKRAEKAEAELAQAQADLVEAEAQHRTKAEAERAAAVAEAYETAAKECIEWAETVERVGKHKEQAFAYRAAASAIRALKPRSDAPQCHPTWTECPLCHNDIRQQPDNCTLRLRSDMVSVPRELLSDLYAYGLISTVEAVVYGRGRSHRERLDEAHSYLAAEADKEKP